MDNLSTASDISSLIGALELGDHPASCGDDVLESAGANTAFGPDPTYLAYGTARCCPPGIFAS
jgi:hypothetical protein